MTTFDKLGLDVRVSKSIGRLGFQSPTPVQERCIALMQEGKDILAKAPTGSGKTIAYVAPIVHRLLTVEPKAPGVRVLVLVPSAELVGQVASVFQQCVHYCKDIRVLPLPSDTALAAQRVQLRDLPEIVLATPARWAAHVGKGHVDVRATLEVLVVDEADMVLSYGHGRDLEIIAKGLPNGCQTLLMSATLTMDVEKLRGMLLHDPVEVSIDVTVTSEDKLLQYLVKCKEDVDKFLYLYGMLRLGILKGRMMVFVDSLNACFKLRLFLEQFSIRCSVLNADLPVNSRRHILSEFERGVFDILIAADEVEDEDEEDEKKKETDYSAARGVDYTGVRYVVNMAPPSSPDVYVHRVGRTARGDDRGTAITMVCGQQEEKRMEDIVRHQQHAMGREDPVALLNVDDEAVNNLRYRVKTALERVTRKSIRDARALDLRRELLNSEKLRTHFEHHPADEQELRHDVALHPAKVIPGMKVLPGYLLSERARAKLKPRKTRGMHIPMSKQRAAAWKRKQRVKAGDPLKAIGRKRRKKKQK